MDESFPVLQQAAALVPLSHSADQNINKSYQLHLRFHVNMAAVEYKLPGANAIAITFV